jgi:LysM repeat protein
MAQRVPDYNEIGGEPSGYKDGHPYKIAVQPDSHGNPGIWHVYQDRSKDAFIAGGMDTPAPAPAAPIPAPPAPTPPAPSNPTGGTQAPDGAAPPTATATAGPAEAVPVATPDSSVVLHPDSVATVVADAPSAPATATPDSDQTATGSLGQASASASATPTPAQDLHVSDDGGLHTTSPQSQSQSVVPGGSTYTVAPGDTLSAIAAAHSVELSQLEALNPGITDPNLILPGQQINLGDASNSPIQVATAAPASATPGVDPSFPTTSTYDTNTTAVDTSNAQRVPGWVGAAAEAVSDPVEQVIQAASATQAQTDPLRIEDNRH